MGGVHAGTRSSGIRSGEGRGGWGRRPRRGPGRKGGAGHRLSPAHTHRSRLTDAPRALGGPRGSPTSGPVEGTSKLTCLRPPPPPHRRAVPLGALRPASQDHAPSSLWPIAGGFCRVPTPSVCFAQYEPSYRGSHAPNPSPPRAAVQLPGGLRPGCARLSQGCTRRRPQRMRAGSPGPAEREATPRACARVPIRRAWAGGPGSSGG